jgi:Flp pilus assembly protein TadD
MTPQSRRARAEAPRGGGPASARVPRAAPGAGWLLAAALLFLLAFAWRIGFLNRLSASVLGGSLIEDAHSYWSWSGFLRTHGLLGTNAFFLGPLYPYVLAGLRALVGDSVPHVLLIQAGWGSLAVVLLADAARRLTSPWIGLGVGAVAAFYEMAVFFDGQVLMESLLYFLESLLLWLVIRAGGRVPRARSLVGLGVLVGLLAEGRATSALLLVPLAWLAAGLQGGRWRARARAVGAVLAGFVLVVTPVAVRNRVVSGEWIPFTYNLGYNLYMGNNPEATGGSVPIAGTSQASPVDPSRADGGQELDGREYLRMTTGRALSPKASSAYWAGRAAEFAREHPARVAGLTLRRLGMVWNRREYPQIENVDEYRAVVGPVGLPFVGSFAFLGPLALAGLGFAWARSGRTGRFLGGYAAVVTLGIIPFFVTDRYRHHLVPALLLLAAIGIQTIVTAWGGRRTAPRAWCAAAVLAGWIITWLPAPGLSRDRLAWEIDSDLAMGLVERGDYEGAVRRFEQAIRIERAERRPGTRATGSALERAQLFAGYGEALRQLGRLRDALPWLEQARALAPDDATIAAALAEVYSRTGPVARADSVRARMSGLVGGEGRALASRGWEAARGGRFAEAESLFARAVAVEPGLSEAWGALIRLQVQQGKLRAARLSLERAGRGGLAEPALRAHEALVSAASGDRVAAEAALARVSPAARAADPTLADVVRVTRQFLDRPR